MCRHTIGASAAIVGAIGASVAIVEAIEASVAIVGTSYSLAIVGISYSVAIVGISYSVAIVGRWFPKMWAVVWWLIRHTIQYFTQYTFKR